MSLARCSPLFQNLRRLRGLSPLLGAAAALLASACVDEPAAKLDAEAPAAVENAGSAALRATCPAPTILPVSSPALEVPILGDPPAAMGVFDPSVIYPAGAPGGAMAYTAVPNQHAHRTRIALSGSGGATWSYVVEANQPELALVASSDPSECPGGLCLGYLNSEVPSLVYDPTDPDEGARWKLFAHRYLAETNDRLHYPLGTITLQTAREPQGPWTAPRKLFGVPSSSPYTLDGTLVNLARFPATADCVALTEPSALWTPDRLDVALGCVYLPSPGSSPQIRVVLLRSLDHGRSWSAVARVLEPGAADCLPGTAAGASVNAPNLFIAGDGRQYLAASSSDATGYHGCAIYRFDSPGTGHLEREASGAPRVLRTLVADTGQFSGACTWSAGGGGYLMDVGFLGAPRPFRIARAPAAVP